MSAVEFTSDEDLTVDHEVRELFRTLTNEVHANSVELGKLAGEVGRVADWKRAVDTQLHEMRAAIGSIPDEAEDTAKHEVAKLKEELAKQEVEELREQLAARRDSVRVSSDRRWQLAIQAGALVIASGLGAVITHLVHVLGK